MKQRRGRSPRREHRYYKRVTNIAATICWGVALSVSLSLPRTASAVTQQGQPVPAPFPKVAPTAIGRAVKLPPPPKPAPYTVAWTKPVDVGGALSLLLTSSSLIVTGVDAETRAFALDDGRVLWTTPAGSDIDPVLSGSTLLLAAGTELSALDLVSGERRWSVPLGGETLGIATQTDVAFVAAGNKLSAYRVSDGASIWTSALAAAPRTAVAVSEAAVVVGMTDGTLAAFVPNTGQPLWRVPLTVTPTAIAVSTDRVYFGTAEHFACAVRLTNGRPDWCYRARVMSIGPPAVDAVHVYWAFVDNTVRVFDRRNGARRQSVALNARPLDGPRLAASQLTPQLPQLVVPLVIGEFVFFTPGNAFTPTRFHDPESSTVPPLLQGSAIATDGSTLAMLTVSPSGRALIMFTRSPAAEPAPAAQAPTTKSGGRPASAPATSPK